MMTERKIVFPTPEEKRIQELERENKILKAQNQALADQAEFHTDVLTEIILTITP